MARKKKTIDPARIRELNGGDEAYERHERVQRRLLDAIARINQRIEASRRAWEREHGKPAS